jgi:CMP-N-acetylneuraminic acid synthetase
MVTAPEVLAPEVLAPEVLALIPARGGSKSIPRKNIRLFNGHPLIAYSIAAARASTRVTRVIVSTDDPEIASIAREYQAETPFLRPGAISGDLTPDLPVFQHALQWLAENETTGSFSHPEIVVQLRPTSPLRRVIHIDAAIQGLIDHPAADSIRTICTPFQNPFKMWRVAEDGFMKPLIPAAMIQLDMTQAGAATEFFNQAPDSTKGNPESAEAQSGHFFDQHQGLLSEPYNLPRQLLPEVFWQTGYVDAARSSTILKKNSMTGEHILPLIINPDEWIDIDSPGDWRRAERLLESGEISYEYLGFTI